MDRSIRMEANVPTINTQRLKPLCQRTTRTVMSILENGDVSMEILVRLQAGNQDGSQMVQEMVHISGDGMKVQCYQNTQGSVRDGVNGSTLCWAHQEFVFPELPPKLLKKYTHAYRFVELVKSKTPKIVLTTDRAKCKLMENSPDPDVQADFHGGMSILLSKGKVHVTDPDGNSITSDVNSLAHNIPENILTTYYYYLKQCESECLRLEESFKSLKTNNESPELFPISIGTSTSPVFIPPPHTTTDSPSVSSHALIQDQIHFNIKECIGINDNNGFSSDASSCRDFNSSALSIPFHNLDQTTHAETPESLATKLWKQQQYNLTSTHSKIPCSLNTQENVCLPPIAENKQLECHISSNQSQCNLLNVNTGANFFNTTSDLPHECQSNFGVGNSGDVDNNSHAGSIESAYLPASVTPENNMDAAHTAHVQNSSIGYNKFKYCSNISDEDSGIVGESVIQRDLFQEHLGPSVIHPGENIRVPCQCECSNLQLTHPELQNLQQPVNVQPSNENPHISMNSYQSSSDISIHSQTFSSFSSSSDKKNVIVSTPSGSSSNVVNSSSSLVTREIIDASNDSAFCFSPVRSSSVISPCPNQNTPHSPNKTQRKRLSLDIPSALENQMKGLELNSSQSDSLATGGTPQSTGNEKCLHSTQNTPLKNTPRNLSFNSSFSNSKINDRLRMRQDQLNSSLPLSYDSNSRHSGLSSIPVTPQMQFLQSSDTSGDHGNGDFALPPQVRHSLDLSTSSNYSDSPSSSQSSSCEPLYQVFVPYTGWVSCYASGAMWVLYNDGTQLGVKANEKTMTFIDQDGSQKKYNNKDVVPDLVKMKLESFPSILNAVLNYKK